MGAAIPVLNMVVEGVESARQRDALASLGCNKAQGFHFFRPMPSSDIEQQLLKQREERA